MSNSEATLPGIAPGPRALREGAERRAVSVAELKRWLTAQVRAHEGCEGVRVIGVFRLDKAGADGCNWSHALVVEPGGTPAPVYALACAEVVGRGHALFMLAP